MDSAATALCDKSCDKLEECAKKMGGQPAGSSSPEGWQKAPASAKAQALKNEMDAKAGEIAASQIKSCRQNCKKDLSEAKASLAKVETCLPKDCDAYFKCLDE